MFTLTEGEAKSGAGVEIDLKKEFEDGAESDNKISNLFEEFFRSFSKKVKKETIIPYMQQIQELPAYSHINNTRDADNRGDFIFYIHEDDLPPELHDFLFRSSRVEDNIINANEAVKSIFSELHPDIPEEIKQKISTRVLIEDDQRVIPIRSIDIDLRNNFLLFDATIVATSEVKSAMKTRRYRCLDCPQIYDRPTKVCIACKSKSVKFSLEHSQFTKFQIIELQERQDDRNSSNAVPSKLDAKLYGDLVNKYRPGDNVRVTGFAKLNKSISDKQLSATLDEEFSTDILYEVVVVVHNLQLLSTSYDTIVNDPTKILAPQDIKEIQDIRQKYKDNDDELAQILVNSFANHILGWDFEKEAILYQEVGSVIIEINKHTMKRPDINILLVGDPGTTKTSLLEEAAKLSIHGIYTSGKGSSGVGLTASVGKDGKGINRLTVGAAVLADKGLCAVDEFLTISDEDRDYLLQSMESGYFSINKGGINARLNTRTSFLMATNSENGKYNPYATFKQNVPLSDQHLSRFGFISVMRDIVKRETDERVADHMISLYYPSYKKTLKQKEVEAVKITFQRDFLFKWLVYAKTHNLEGIVFTPEAIKLIKNFYNEIRTPEKETDITATPRQLEDIIRFCIARARLMLRNEVNEFDVLAVIRLMTYGYQSCGFMLKGAKSSGLNMTAEYAKPLNKLSKPLAFIEVMIKLTNGNKEPVDRETIEIELVRKAGWELSEATDFFYKMYENKGELIQTVPGKYLLTRSPSSSGVSVSSAGGGYMAHTTDKEEGEPGKIKTN